MYLKMLNYKIKMEKIIVLITFVFIFSIIYMFLDDTNFNGINNIQETIKNEIIKQKIQKEISENFDNLNNNNNKKEKIIDKITKETKDIVTKKELVLEKIQPSIFQKFFDRLYFSAITGSTLGYGDIFPVSNAAKFLVLIQAISTIIIIIS